MMELHDGFAQRLRQHCARQGLSQAQIARKYGHSLTSVNHYLAGRHVPREENESAFANAIGVTRNTLREWLGRPPIDDPDTDSLDHTMAELRLLLDPMHPGRRKAIVTIVQGIAQL